MAGTSTFATEYAKVQRRIGDDSATTLVEIKQWLNDAYHAIAETFDWPWLHYEGAINLVATYTTGTVTLVDDTTDYVTTTGAWDTGWTPLRLRTAGGNEYTLTYNSGNTRWELDRDIAVAESGVTYTLFKDRYSLAARLRSVYLATTTTGQDWPVAWVTPEQMAAFKSTGIVSASPVRAACFGSPDSNIVSQIEVYPAPDAVHSLHLKGYREVADLSADADTFLFPIGVLSPFRHLVLSLAFDWRGNAERSNMEFQKYLLEINKVMERSDPEAGAGDQIQLDVGWFRPRGFGYNNYGNNRITR